MEGIAVGFKEVTEKGWEFGQASLWGRLIPQGENLRGAVVSDWGPDGRAAAELLWSGREFVAKVVVVGVDNYKLEADVIGKYEGDCEGLIWELDNRMLELRRAAKPPGWYEDIPLTELGTCIWLDETKEEMWY